MFFFPKVLSLSAVRLLLPINDINLLSIRLFFFFIQLKAGILPLFHIFSYIKTSLALIGRLGTGIYAACHFRIPAVLRCPGTRKRFITPPRK